MKRVFFILCVTLFLNGFLKGQEKMADNIPENILDCLAEMGNDTLSILNVCEGNYLNHIYQKRKGAFDFCGKKAAFYKGHTGTIERSKKEYFEREKDYIYQNGYLPSGGWQLIIFSEDEKMKTGYDVVIFSGNKKYVTNKEMIKRLKKKK